MLSLLGLLGTLFLLLLRTRLLGHLDPLVLLWGLLLRLSDPLLWWLLHLRLLLPLLPGLLDTLSLLLLLNFFSPLLRLLSGLPTLLPLLVLLLSACLRLLRLPLGVLPLRRWRRALLLPALLPFGLVLFFVILVALRVRRDNRPKKQKEGNGTGSSNEFHNNPSVSRYRSMHADPHSRLIATIFHSFLTIGPK